MKEFITEYPVFSYIAIPVLCLILLVSLFVLLKPRNQVKDGFSKLFLSIEQTLRFLDEHERNFDYKHLSVLKKMIGRSKYYYEYLESEELYEVEKVMAHILQARNVTKALLIAKYPQNELQMYLGCIQEQLQAARKVLFNFHLRRSEEQEVEFSVLDSAYARKSKKKARDYLEHLKK